MSRTGQTPRVMIAAVKSGSGKTALTCALIELLKRSGRRTAAFKCGPDYIDPMFHRQVLGVPSYNLDTFFLPRDEAAELFARHTSDADIAVIEGVMGYFDGLGGKELTASSYDIACAADSPVILVIDAKGMSRSVIPLLRGFCSYEEERHIKGVILNRVSAMTYGILKPMIEEETGLTVCGYVPVSRNADWGSRHLGLMQPEEIPAIREKIGAFASELSETLDLASILQIAEEGRSRSIPEENDRTVRSDVPAARVQIAVALDEAFSFYYQDNLDLLRELGAEPVFFSPLHDRALPDADGLLLGGGYPELHAEELSKNESMLADIRRAAEEKMPILAECGGFLYLGRSLESYPMAGVLPGDAAKTEHLVRFGYVTVSAREDSSGNVNGFLRPGESIRAHEFHYADSSNNGDACTAGRHSGNRNWPCMVLTDRMLAGFPHLYYRSNPRVAERFVRAAEEYRSERMK